MSRQRKTDNGRLLGTVEEVARAWGVKRRLDRALLLGRAYQKCLDCTVEVSGRSKVQAGAANTRLGKIMLNAALLEPGREADRNATFLHECAHILADSVYRRNCQHGPYWKRVMELLGENPDVHHDLEYLSPKAQAVATWVCRACGEEYHYVRKPRHRPQDCYCARCGPRRGRLEAIEMPPRINLDPPPAFDSRTEIGVNAYQPAKKKAAKSKG
ncbi:MAG: SprT-like domain-containing protein [Alphaproteobacteria bacterium]